MPLLWERLLSRLSLSGWRSLSQTCRACRALSQGPSADAVLQDLVQASSQPAGAQLTGVAELSAPVVRRQRCQACDRLLTNCAMRLTGWQT